MVNEGINNSNASNKDSIKDKIIFWKRPTNALGPHILSLMAAGVKSLGGHVEIRDPLGDFRENKGFSPGDIRRAGTHAVWNPLFNNSDKIVYECRKWRKSCVVTEFGFVGRNAKNIKKGYWSVGFWGAKGRGFYNNKNSPADRWERLKGEFNIELKPKRREDEGEYILIAMQQAGDSSLEGVDPWKWVRAIVDKIWQYTDRPIMIRPVPKDVLSYKKGGSEVKDKYIIPGCLYSEGSHVPIGEDLKRAWALVTFASNAAIDALIEGIPVFAMNHVMLGGLHNSLNVVGDSGKVELGEGLKVLRDGYENSNSGDGGIKFPNDEEKEQFFRDLAYAQWNGEELESGEAWKHLMGGSLNLNGDDGDGGNNNSIIVNGDDSENSEDSSKNLDNINPFLNPNLGNPNNNKELNQDAKVDEGRDDDSETNDEDDGNVKGYADEAEAKEDDEKINAEEINAEKDETLIKSSKKNKTLTQRLSKRK